MNKELPELGNWCEINAKGKEGMKRKWRSLNWSAGRTLINTSEILHEEIKTQDNWMERLLSLRCPGHTKVGIYTAFRSWGWGERWGLEISMPTAHPWVRPSFSAERGVGELFKRYCQADLGKNLGEKQSGMGEEERTGCCRKEGAVR